MKKGNNKQKREKVKRGARGSLVPAERETKIQIHVASNDNTTCRTTGDETDNGVVAEWSKLLIPVPWPLMV